MRSMIYDLMKAASSSFPCAAPLGTSGGIRICNCSLSLMVPGAFLRTPLSGVTWVSQNTKALFRKANRTLLKFVTAAQKTVSQIKKKKALSVNSHTFWPYPQSLTHNTKIHIEGSCVLSNRYRLRSMYKIKKGTWEMVIQDASKFWFDIGSRRHNMPQSLL